MTINKQNIVERSTAKTHMPDVQGHADSRQIEIQRVGIKDLRHPIEFLDKNTISCRSVANVSMSVSLPKERKGTHMSRFIQLLNERSTAFSIAGLNEFLDTMLQRLNADEGQIDLQFPYFINKKAPVSGVTSLMDYQVHLTGSMKMQQTNIRIKLIVPVTSLCPCSKEISDYGAHNQRSHITLNAEISADSFLEDIIQLLETQASAELYAVLKRSDEKYVTEQAYDNPKFVEDIIRDLANALDQQNNITGYKLEVENFEAIHNHSAYAMIEKP